MLANYDLALLLVCGIAAVQILHCTLTVAL